MPDNRILFVSQEIAPYLPKNEISTLGRELPKAMQAKGYEPRIFMPKYGTVNERRNQLHEVIRLSGLNIVIDDADHPLILKVASMQPSRIQVYFVDNDDYFQKLDEDADPVGSNRDDNDERAIFFARGTMETVKKLRWEPKIIHCSGWMTALSPMYLRRMYADDSSFAGAKIVYSVIPGEITGKLDPRIFEKLHTDGMNPEEIKEFTGINPDTSMMHRLALRYCDAAIFATDNPDPALVEYARERNLPMLMNNEVADNPDAYDNFYKTLTD